VREKQGPHDSRISQLRAKIVAKRVASQIKGQRDSEVYEREEQADEIIAFGEAVAAGGIDENGQPAASAQQSEKTLALTPARKSSLGFAIARKAYRMAMKRLRGKAAAEAERNARADSQGAAQAFGTDHETGPHHEGLFRRPNIRQR
jgi:hypothetical protein